MSLSPALCADLEKLTAHLVPLDRAELPAAVELWERAAVLRVGSLVGWVVTVVLDGQPLTVTSIQPLTSVVGPVRASLRLPFPFLSHNAAGRVVLYASQPAAFDLFASEVAAALDLVEGELELDGDLSPTLVPGVTGLTEWCMVNRSVGVMLDGGDLGGCAAAVPDQTTNVVDLDAYRVDRNLLHAR